MYLDYDFLDTITFQETQRLGEQAEAAKNSSVAPVVVSEEEDAEEELHSSQLKRVESSIEIQYSFSLGSSQRLEPVIEEEIVRLLDEENSGTLLSSTAERTITIFSELPEVLESVDGVVTNIISRASADDFSYNTHAILIINLDDPSRSTQLMKRFIQ